MRSLTLEQALAEADLLIGRCDFPAVLNLLRQIEAQLATPSPEVMRRIGLALLFTRQEAAAVAAFNRCVQLGDSEALACLTFVFNAAGLSLAEKWNQYQFTRMKTLYLDSPREINVETYTQCNAACGFCPYSRLERKGEKMPDALIDKLIADLAAIPTDRPFSISPFKVNDPFLDKRIYGICEKINRDLPHAHLRLFTNGSPITEAMLERVNALRRVHHLWVSLNYVDAEQYFAGMGLRFEQVTGKLDLLHRWVEQGRFSHPVSISRVGDGAVGDREFLDYVARRWPLFAPTVIGRGDWLGAVDTHLGVPNTGCSRWFELSIMSTGKVALCCMDGEGKVVLGDIARQSVLEIYNLPAYRKMRQYTPSRLAAAAPCDTCAFG